MPRSTLDTAGTTTTAHHLRSLKVYGGFLDGLNFEFSGALNCITGPKGSGKTSIIEFIRYALDAMPDQESQPRLSRQIESLIAANLGTGRIELGIETKEGIAYTITRTWGEEPLVLTADGEPTAINPRKGLFAADIFSVNEIGSIAENPPAQLVLLDRFEQERVDEINAKIASLQDRLRANASAMIPMEDQLTKLNEELEHEKDLDDRIKALAATQVGDLHELNVAHEEKSLLDRQHKIMLEAQAFVETMGRKFQDTIGKLPFEAKRYFEGDLLQGGGSAIVDSARQELLRYAREIEDMMKRATDASASTRNSLAGFAKDLTKLSAKHELEFRKLQDKHEDSKQKVAERAKLERQRNDLLARRRLQRNVVHDLQHLGQQREQMLHELSSLLDERSAVRQAVVDRINEALMPAIRVSMAFKADRSAYCQLVQECLAGTSMRYQAVAAKLVETFSPPELVDIVKRQDHERLFSEARINRDQANKVINALADDPRLFDIQTVELADHPTVELLDGEIYKNSLGVSSGQKCTAILPILLLDSYNPLLIDQPEENLDNAFIYETMVSTLLRMKSRRQMLFVTHNPNIPVLGDAEMFVRMESNGGRAQIVMHGSVESLRDRVMHLEGGPEAFEGRMKRYGY